MIERDGERGGNRTFNLLIKSQLLCQLSYAPELNTFYHPQPDFRRKKFAAVSSIL
jgi:hypothetical protein